MPIWRARRHHRHAEIARRHHWPDLPRLSVADPAAGRVRHPVRAGHRHRPAQSGRWRAGHRAAAAAGAGPVLAAAGARRLLWPAGGAGLHHLAAGTRRRHPSRRALSRPGGAEPPLAAADLCDRHARPVCASGRAGGVRCRGTPLRHGLRDRCGGCFPAVPADRRRNCRSDPPCPAAARRAAETGHGQPAPAGCGHRRAAAVAGRVAHPADRHRAGGKQPACPGGGTPARRGAGLFLRRHPARADRAVPLNRRRRARRPRPGNRAQPAWPHLKHQGRAQRADRGIARPALGACRAIAA